MCIWTHLPPANKQTIINMQMNKINRIEFVIVLVIKNMNRLILLGSRGGQKYGTKYVQYSHRHRNNISKTDTITYIA